MRAIRTLALIGILGSGLFTGCGLEDLVDDVKDLMKDPQVMAAFSSATVQDALEQLDLSLLSGGAANILPQAPIGLGVQQAEEPEASPGFAPLTMQDCDVNGDPLLDDIPADKLCAISAPSGPWQLDMVWYYHVDWAEAPNYPTTDAFLMHRPKLDPSNDGSVYSDDDAAMYPSISIVELSGTLSRPKLGITGALTFTNLSYSDYNLALGQADVFNNDIHVTKEVSFTNEDAKVKQLKESFKGNLHGAPDNDASLIGVNGVVDVTDTAWYFSQFAEGRKGAKIYREITAAPGGNLIELGGPDGTAIPGSYAEIVTPAESGRVKTISRLATVTDADNLTLKEIVTYANDTTAYRMIAFTTTTVTVTGQFQTPKGEGTHTATLTRDGGSFSSTRIFPEGMRISRINETGSLTSDGSEFVRTITLADGTTVTESATVSIVRNADGSVDTVTVKYDRGDEGTVTLTANPGEFGFVDLTVDAVGGDNTKLHITGTLDKSGAGELTLTIDRPDVAPDVDIQGTLQRASDGSVSGTLQVTDAEGKTQEVEVAAEADAFNRLLARARADAQGTARADAAAK